MKIITDSTSDITLCTPTITVLPITIQFGNRHYKDGVDLSHKEFYNLLVENNELPTTSQISPFDFEKEFKALREAHEEAIVITLSKKLSGTYQSAVIASKGYEDIVSIIDSENVSVGEKVLVEYMDALIKSGMGRAELVKKAEKAKERISIIALVDTLEYLKRGGRISKTAAFAGEMLSLKPVLTIKDGELSILGKARGSKNANNFLREGIEKFGGVDFSLPCALGYTGQSDLLLKKYIEDSKSLYEGHENSLEISTIGAAVGVHAGPGAIAIAFFKKS